MPCTLLCKKCYIIFVACTLVFVADWINYFFIMTIQTPKKFTWSTLIPWVSAGGWRECQQSLPGSAGVKTAGRTLQPHPVCNIKKKILPKTSSLSTLTPLSTEICWKTLKNHYLLNKLQMFDYFLVGNIYNSKIGFPTPSSRMNQTRRSPDLK